jgi:hypothetical protein
MSRFLLVLLWAMVSTAEAATYYVSTTGNDSTGTGTEASPWRNPQKCAASPVAAGDTCIVKSGTYTDADANGITVYVNSASASGTASLPITIKSEVPLGAIIKVREDSSLTQAGFYISKPYYVIEGFDIDGSGGTGTSTNTQSGIAIWANGVRVVRNKIHHMGRQFCSSSVNAMTGVYVAQVTDVYIGYNEFYTIGRKRGVVGFQESGCTLTPGGQGTAAHDHAIYASQGTRLTIERNVIYDTQRGYGFHLYKSSAVTNPTVKFEHNTIHGEGDIGVGPHTSILVNNAMSDASLKNNLFSAPRFYAAFPFNVTFSGTSVFAGNRTTVGTWWKDGNPVGLDMSSPGTLSASMGFTASGSNDFTLASTSGAINAGVSTNAVKSGTQEDSGAFEAFSVVSASITGSTMTVVTDVSFLPLQLTGTTGFSVGCTGTGCGTPVVGTATVVGTGNSISLTITGITGSNCAVGQTWTVTYNGTHVKDSINVGGHLNQPMHAVTSYGVTNSCTGSPPAPPGGMVIRYEADENTGTTLVSNGTLVGGTWGVGQSGYGVVLTSQSAQYVTVPYGSGFDPSATSLTMAFWVNVDASATGLARTYAGAQLGTNQRVYVSTFLGSWRIGIQSSNDATAGDIAVTSGLHHVCLEMNSSTDVATLYIDKVASTAAGAVKSYTSYTFASNFEWGRLAGSANGPGGTFDRFTIIENHGKCGELYDSEVPAAPPATGTYTQVTHRWEGVHFLPGNVVESKSSNGGSLTCVSGGCTALHVQIQCDNVAACASTPFPLYYAVDGGSFSNQVPAVPTSAGVYMYGPVSDTTVNHFTADGPLTACGTHVDGPTTTTEATTLQSYSMVQNSCLTVRYLFCFSADAVNKTFQFKIKTSGGVDFGTYSVIPSITIAPPQANGGN